MLNPEQVIDKATQGLPINQEEALSLANFDQLDELLAAATQIRDSGHDAVITYSPKVFIPLTHLCRDVCHYCTFANPPRLGESAYLSAEEILAIARAGVEAGCHEALFTLGDKPELRYKTARQALQELGHETTISYLAEMAQLVLDETGLLPHLNPGVLKRNELAQLRTVSISQGMMLESGSERLAEKGMPHYGSPDKHPYVRLGSLAAAGAVNVPMTSGILIGIGETRQERIESLLSLRELNDSYGHLQELIIQNFKRKADTKMRNAPEPSREDLLWTIAVARIIFGGNVNIQAPPNLSPEALPEIIRAGINDWGGISPVTPDHVNPEAPWPHLGILSRACEAEGKTLIPRLPLYPKYTENLDKWVDPKLHKYVLDQMDAEGFARTGNWSPGASTDIVAAKPIRLIGADVIAGTPVIKTKVSRLVDKAVSGVRLDEQEISTLFSARGRDYENLCVAADELRKAVNGDTVTYIVNRNINYTNVCYFRCQFCAFSKGRSNDSLRGKGYDLPLEEIQQRVTDGWDRGAIEVCLQGGIHPSYTGQTYIDIVKAVKQAQPNMHVHAFSALEITQGAQTLGIPVLDFLKQLKAVGLGTLPGTAAEILDDEIRNIICHDKLNTQEWLDVIRAAHSIGLPTTSTIMYGHVERPVHWARHLLHLRDLQEETGGFTEFVPLPYVHMEAPLYRKGKSRRGPTFREAVLMHAVARLTLYPHINNIQTSWVKMGQEGIKACLRAGVNDLGGTLMDESISRAAGAAHGQEMNPAQMTALIESVGRRAQQRDTRYHLIGGSGVGTLARSSGVEAIAARLSV